MQSFCCFLPFFGVLVQPEIPKLLRRLCRRDVVNELGKIGVHGWPGLLEVDLTSYGAAIKH